MQYMYVNMANLHRNILFINIKLDNQISSMCYWHSNWIISFQILPNFKSWMWIEFSNKVIVEWGLIESKRL